jgi:hypothetical protein
MEVRAKELKAYFESVELPKTLELNKSELITNVEKFIQSHLQVVLHNSKNKVFKPYLDRLEQVKTIIKAL